MSRVNREAGSDEPVERDLRRSVKYRAGFLRWGCAEEAQNCHGVFPQYPVESYLIEGMRWYLGFYCS